VIRKRLRGPEIFLATEEEVNDLLKDIAGHSDKLRKELDELTGEHNMGGVESGMCPMP
jgi:hypothetical protein